MNFSIRRSDGFYYAGTADHIPRWGSEKAAVTFRERDDAFARVDALTANETDGRTFLVVEKED